MVYTVYTDGSCSGNPGPGGFAFVAIPENGSIIKCSRPYEHTTNNRMELSAIIYAIKNIKSQCNYSMKSKTIIEIYSDSSYCLNPIEQNWIKVWKFTGWKNSKGQEIKNSDLWKELCDLLALDFLDIRFHKVKGHSGNEYNEEVDRLAKEATKRAKERISNAG